MRSRSRVNIPEGREQEWQSSVWPPVAPEKKTQEWTGPGYGPSKSMEVVLGGVTKEVDGKKREVVMITDVATGRQTIKNRFKPGEPAEKDRLAAEGRRLAERGPSGAGADTGRRGSATGRRTWPGGRQLRWRLLSHRSREGSQPKGRQKFTRGKTIR